MKWFSAFKQRHQIQRQENIKKLAEETINISDFDSDLYISYLGTPLIRINKELTSGQILDELSKVRQIFINVKNKAN